MAKKNENGGGNETTRKTRAKGNFAIFLQAEREGDEERKLWYQLVSGLDSTVACEKRIKENAEQFKDKKIMIAQVKKVGEPKVQTKVTVSF